MLTPRAAANLSAHLQRRALTYLEVCKNLEEAATAAKNLKQYMGRGDGRRSGSTLIALGVALIAFPDPTISDAIGTALIALGLLKRKMRKIGVRDVYEEMRQAVSYLKDIKEQCR
ncbi:MAG: hypothetical protein HA494_01725 [Thaumarchaeota archaeon]|nr:hypothetical protein [Nitrososphaerota archaeon]